MEMNGEKIIKKSKKTPMWIIIGYLICLLAIIGAVGYMEYRKKTETPEPIDFTTNGAIDMPTEQYAFLNVEGLTDEVAIYGDVENEYDSSNDRYYIAISGGYLYVVDLDYDTIDLLKPLQEYTYSTDENAIQPEPVKIYGMTENVPVELKQMVIDYYNESVGEEYAINVEDFELYFGSVLLNVRKVPVDTVIEEMIVLLAIVAIITLAVTHIAIMSITKKTKKYLKKNEYEDELARQLDDCVEEKHYKEKIILTRDFLVDLKNGGLIAIKYSDIKWIHIHNVKTYGVVTVSSSIIIYLNDGKTKFQCVETRGKTTEEFLEIFNKICEKAPAESLKGFTPENAKAFKEYKKSLKTNTL